jgi:hypothetical protein
MDLGEIRWGGVVWTGLAQDRDKWRALVNTERTLGCHKILGNYPVAIQLVIRVIREGVIIECLRDY